MKDIVIKHLCDSMYSINDRIVYDSAMYVYAVSLAEEVKKHFNVDIELAEDVRAIALYYKGRKVNGNNFMPKRCFISETWGNKYELMTEYDFDSVKCCFTCHADLEECDIILLAKEVAGFLNTNDILSQSFYECMTNKDMKYICNCMHIAVKLIDFYSPFVSVADGINAFNDMSKTDDYKITIPSWSAEFTDKVRKYNLH